jgi:hypothetical protein
MSKHELSLISEEGIRDLSSLIRVPTLYSNPEIKKVEEKITDEFIAKENNLRDINTHFSNYIKGKDSAELYRAAFKLGKMKVKLLIFNQTLIEYVSSILKRVLEEVDDNLASDESKKHDDTMLLFASAYLKTDIELCDYIKIEIATKKYDNKWQYFYAGTIGTVIVCVAGGLIIGPQQFFKKFNLNLTKATATIAFAGITALGGVTGGILIQEAADKIFHYTEMSISQKKVLRKEAYKKEVELRSKNLKKNGLIPAKEQKENVLLEDKGYEKLGITDINAEKERLLREQAMLAERLKKLDLISSEKEKKKEQPLGLGIGTPQSSSSDLVAVSIFNSGTAAVTTTVHSKESNSTTSQTHSATNSTSEPSKSSYWCDLV